MKKCILYLCILLNSLHAESTIDKQKVLKIIKEAKFGKNKFEKKEPMGKQPIVVYRKLNNKTLKSTPLIYGTLPQIVSSSIELKKRFLFPSIKKHKHKQSAGFISPMKYKPIRLKNIATKIRYY